MNDTPPSEPFEVMLDLVRQLPDQLDATAGLVQAVSLPSASHVRRVVVCGMGGSAAAGTLARGVLGEGQLQIDVQQTYRVPSNLTEASMLVFSSYSGDTEETLEAYEDARQRFGQVLSVAVTSGGALAERAARDGVPCVTMPGGLPPRTALGYSFGILLRLLERLALADRLSEGLQEASAILREGNAEYAPGRPASENAARSLARRLYGKLPLLYAGFGLGEAVAQRWKAQINENAKCLAAVSILPELDHNEIVGWEVASPVRPHAFVVALRDAQDHPRVQRRFEITKDVLGPRVQGWETVRSRGHSPVARALSLVQLGDYLSVYLSQECGVDPVQVHLIDALKSRLADIG
jgi:glucose/mannose-6-phosphate isomerase